MKFTQAAKTILLCLAALSTQVQNKLVVYGPQELIDKFNQGDSSIDGKSKLTKRINVCC